MIQKIGVIKDGIILLYILHSHNFYSLLFEIKELKRSLTHILCLDTQLETQVFLKDGSFWTVGLSRSDTPLCAPSLQRRRSASTVPQKNTQRDNQSLTATKQQTHILQPHWNSQMSFISRTVKYTSHRDAFIKMEIGWGRSLTAKQVFSVSPCSMGQLSSRSGAGSPWGGTAGCQGGGARGSGCWQRMTGEQCTLAEPERRVSQSRRQSAAGSQHHSWQST